MADSEDWRRRRAEELRLHDAGPFAARPARERQPIVDSVEPMRQPVAPVPPSAFVADPLPNRVEPRRGAEPAARRHRPQSPLVSGAADAPMASAPDARRLSGAPSFAARHPLVLGAGIAAALAGAGALGWMLHAKVEPVRVVVATAAREVPAAIAPRMPEAPVSTIGAGGLIADPIATVPPTAMTAPLQKFAVDSKPRRTSAAKAAIVAPQLLETGTPEAPAVETPTFLPATARAPKPAADPTSRFAHPAKAVALPGREFSPSFNCRRAIAAVNRAICANPELSALDRQVSQRFYRATASVDLERHKAIDRDQVDFLNERARCNSDDCVAGVYRRRLDALRNATPDD